MRAAKDDEAIMLKSWYTLDQCHNPPVYVLAVRTTPW